jgi:imidazolonepropionase-like amidohydrolase
MIRLASSPLTLIQTIAFAILLLPASVPAQQAFIVRNVRVFNGQRTEEHRSVLVDSGRIVRVDGPELRVAGTTVVDGRGRTLLPGLIDSHVHVAGEVNSALRQALVLGVTTVLDMFSDETTFAKIKGARAADLPDVADVRSAGVGATAPGGHPTQMGGGPIPTLRSPDEAQAFVDARVFEGSDYIKIIRDDLSRMAPKPVPTLDSLTIAALVRAAHARGKLAIVHVTAERDARLALGAGVDGLAHLFIADSSSPDFGVFVASHHAFVIPTLEAFSWFCGRVEAPAILADSNIAPYLTPQWRIPLTMTVDWPPRKPGCFGSDDAFRQLVRARVPILAGTDSPIPGTTYGASLDAELALYVKRGMTPEAALASATLVPAETFGLRDRGAIRPGLRADLVLVDGDPTKDILATRRIVAVWKRGMLVERIRTVPTSAR